jgi:hypothetical protein
MKKSRWARGGFDEPSFRDAPLGAGPESITPIVVMDSGLVASLRPGMTKEERSEKREERREKREERREKREERRGTDDKTHPQGRRDLRHRADAVSR